MENTKEIDSSKRIEWIDFAKGIAIFLVVFGHAVEKIFSKNIANYTVYVAIYSFHMPLFFVLSGMVFSDERYKNFKNFVTKKFCTLIVPSYMFILIMILIDVIRNQKIMFGFINVIRTLLQFRVDTIVSYWFLPVLFLAFIIMWCIHKTFKSNTKRIICSLMISLVGALYIYIVQKPLPFSIDNAILIVIFMELGYQLKNNLHLLKQKGNITLICIGLVWAVSTYLNYNYFGKKAISLAYVTLLNPILFFSSAVTGSILIIMLCSKVKNVSRINFWGKNTLVIYLISGSLLSFIVNWVNKLDIKNNVLSLLICLFISIIIIEVSCIFSRLIKKYCPYILGMKKST